MWGGGKGKAKVWDYIGGVKMEESITKKGVMLLALQTQSPKP